MKRRTWLIYVFIGLFVTISLFFVFISNKIDLSRALGASASFPTIIDESSIINAAKDMVSDNINKYEDGETIITIKELIKNKYLTGFEVNPSTNRVYDEDIRIIVTIENGNIKDAYMKNDLFKNVFSCDNVCYLNDNNYIAFNNDYKLVDSKDIDNTLKSYYNDLDKNIVKNVVSISLNDIENSELINIEDNIFVNTNSGYKLYDSITENVENVTDKKANLIPVIILKDDITYEMGEGTKFSPYVVNK